MANSYPTIIPGLRSPSEQVNGLVYFGRMLDKIRLAGAGKLPEGWQPMRGAAKGSFDWRCCQFLKIDYAALETETLKGDKTDAELLEWAFQHGRQPDDQEIEVRRNGNRTLQVRRRLDQSAAQLRQQSKVIYFCFSVWGRKFSNLE